MRLSIDLLEFNLSNGRISERMFGTTHQLGSSVDWSVIKEGNEYLAFAPSGKLAKKSASFSSVMDYVINELPAGGTIRIGAGKFGVDATISIPYPGITIIGSGSVGLQYDGGTILELDPASDKILYVTGRKFTLANIALVGNKGATDKYEILLHDSAGGPADLHVFNVYVMNANGIGVELDGGHSTVVGLITEDNKRGLVVNGDDNYFSGFLSYADDEYGLIIGGSYNRFVGSFFYSMWTATQVNGNYNVLGDFVVRTSAHSAIELNGNYNRLGNFQIYNAGFSVGDYAGIEITGSYNGVSNGSIISDYTTKPNYGLRESAGDYNQILGLIIGGYSTGAYTTVGTNTQVANIIDLGA